MWALGKVVPTVYPLNAYGRCLVKAGTATATATGGGHAVVTFGASGGAFMGMSRETSIGVAPRELALHPFPRFEPFVFEESPSASMGAVYVVARVFGDPTRFKKGVQWPRAREHRIGKPGRVKLA